MTHPAGTFMFMTTIQSEAALAGLAWRLLGGSASVLSRAERTVVRGAAPVLEGALVEAARGAIAQGKDPLGDALMRLRTASQRRTLGAVYTPPALVEAMMSWSAGRAEPVRVVDPGAGSGRFLLEAGRRFPNASLVAIERDPLAALLLRANLSVLGFDRRTSVLVGDYRTARVAPVEGVTLFIGNPPYVRHHDISERWKVWLAETARSFGVQASKLAGLHVHFFLRTLQLARSGDVGSFVTSAEWLDVNYGAVLRRLLANGLGGSALHVLEPRALPFEQTLASAVITCFDVGRRPATLRVRAVRTAAELGNLSGGRKIPWQKASREERWTALLRPGKLRPREFIELGELCNVHRGQVTGGNAVWIAGDHAAQLPPRFLVAAVTKARELTESGVVLTNARILRRVIDLPVDLDQLLPEEGKAVRRFLTWAKRHGAADSYVARHRRAWWAVGLYPPAPILCTYMARRAPVFVRNICEARHINIAHGLYPRVKLSENTILALVRWLGEHVDVASGRTYAGGLTKFEPKELERVHVPRPENLPA